RGKALPAARLTKARHGKQVLIRPSPAHHHLAANAFPGKAERSIRHARAFRPKIGPSPGGMDALCGPARQGRAGAMCSNGSCGASEEGASIVDRRDRGPASPLLAKAV